MVLCVEQVYGAQQHHASRNWFGEVAVDCNGSTGLLSKARVLLPWLLLLKDLLLFGGALCLRAVSVLQMI